MTYTERFEWIFEARGTNASALSEKAGLARSHIRGILQGEKDGRRVRPGAEVLGALAKAANVSFRWLSSGKGPREPYDGDEEGELSAEAPSPVPPSAVNPAENPLSQLISRAMVGREKEYDFLDGLLVREALSSVPPPQDFVDPVVYVRRLLDTAAWHRARGHKVQPKELPALAVGWLDQELTKQTDVPEKKAS